MYDENAAEYEAALIQIEAAEIFLSWVCQNDGGSVDPKGMWKHLAWGQCLDCGCDNYRPLEV